MAATMSSDMDKTDKVVTFIDECRAMNLQLLPPDVNRGRFHFSVDDDGSVIYGLGAIKASVRVPVQNIIDSRRGRLHLRIYLISVPEWMDERSIKER